MCAVSYLRDGILAGPIDDIVQRPLPAHVVDAHELQQRGVDEAHTDAVPHVHGGQIGDHRQRAPETVRGGEEIQHGSDACEMRVGEGKGAGERPRC